MNLHKHQLYLLEQRSESFKSWSAIITVILRVNPWLWNKPRYNSFPFNYWKHRPWFTTFSFHY